MMKSIISWLTMKRGSCAFIDRVDHQEVFNYVDCYGDKYLANWNRFFFRVKV
jgi:hypothetical protein